MPYAVRLERIAAIKTPVGPDPLSAVTRMILQHSMLEAFVRGISRAAATLRAQECLVALRRWQATHTRWPRSLKAAVTEAGMRAVPADPYDGKPLRLVMLAGAPVVYSVGRDGTDDGGQKDSKFDTQDGDLLYRLPAGEEARRIRPS